MDDQELRARLERNEETFKGLMSLIPADDYYGKDSSDQWSRRKQSKVEKRAARKAKLAPGANKSALDVHNENDKKRKQPVQVDADQNLALSKDSPRQTTTVLEKPSKKQKKSHNTAESADHLPSNAGKHFSASVKGGAKQKKNKKNSDSKGKGAKVSQESLVHKESNGIGHQSADVDDFEDSTNGVESEDEKVNSEGLRIADTKNPMDKSRQSRAKKGPQPNGLDNNLISSDNEDQAPIERDEQVRSNKKSDPLDPTHSHHDRLEASLSDLGDSGGLSTTETSSIDNIPNTNATRDGSLKLPKIDPAILQQRLADRIAALREARNADGLDGKPARNRQELIEARRRKDELRKAHKKEMKAKSRASSKNAVEDEVARLRGGSSSPLESLLSPRGVLGNNFSFGHVAFGDGTRANHSLTDVEETKNRKGPSDPKTALLSAQAKQKRLSALDENKRAKVESKSAWHSAEKKIAGEKLKDDTSLLKKTLKRNAQAKKKSENTWNEREEGIRKSQHERQKKREENLKNRKSVKGSRYGLPMRRDTGKQQPKRKRPGFEGTFKTSGLGGGK